MYYDMAIQLLNAVKAWRDCDGNDGFPHAVREQIDALLMAHEVRSKETVHVKIVTEDVVKDAARYQALREQHEVDDEQASNGNYGKTYPPRTLCVFQDDGKDGLEPVPCDPGALDILLDDIILKKSI